MERVRVYVKMTVTTGSSLGSIGFDIVFKPICYFRYLNVQDYVVLGGTKLKHYM